MKRLRFYVGLALMEAGLWIMPFDALASIAYNVNFLSDRNGNGS